VEKGVVLSMNFLFKIRVFLWSIVSEIEYRLYPYKNSEPEVDYFYIVKNDATGEEYTVLEWIKNFDNRLEKIEDNYLHINANLNKVDKLDLDLLDLKNRIYKK
jgi:hypothetical protein